jgi:hypothetical protein
MPPMLSKAKVKNDRGFYHPITAALLCPVKYPKTPQFVFSFFIVVPPTQISTKNYSSNSCWYTSSYSSTPPYLLISWWSCLWPKRHLTQCSSRTYHDKGICHIYHTVIKFTASSRSQSICFKARQLLLSNLVLTVENREMPHYADWHRWLLIRLCMLPYRYVIRI